MDDDIQTRSVRYRDLLSRHDLDLEFNDGLAIALRQPFCHEASDACSIKV